MSDVAHTVLKLALRLAERGDHEGAAEALRGVLAMAPADEPIAPEHVAVSKKTLAKALAFTTKHIDNLERRERIPREAVLGEGAGKRYIIAAVFAALGRTHVDAVAAEGLAYVRRKAKLKLVSGGG